MAVVENVFIDISPKEYFPHLSREAKRPGAPENAWPHIWRKHIFSLKNLDNAVREKLEINDFADFSVLREQFFVAESPLKLFQYGWGAAVILNSNPPLIWNEISLFVSHAARSATGYVGALVSSGHGFLTVGRIAEKARDDEQKASEYSEPNVSDFEFAIISLRPFLFFVFSIGITVLGYCLQSARQNYTKNYKPWFRRWPLKRTWGMLFVLLGPVVFVYGWL